MAQNVKHRQTSFEELYEGGKMNNCERDPFFVPWTTIDCQSRGTATYKRGECVFRGDDVTRQLSDSRQASASTAPKLHGTKTLALKNFI